MKEGKGSAQIDGTMVDVRTVYPLRMLLARVDTIDAKEKKKARGRELIGEALGKKGESR